MDYLVYEYGCLSPVNGREAALEQMLRRRRLWNSLVEIERDYRSRISAVLRDETTEQHLSAARDRLSTLRSEIKARRRAERKRGVNISDLQEEIVRAKIDIAATCAAARESRRARIAHQKHTLDLLETARRVAVKQVQADSDLYWCNYDDIVASYETARRRALREGRELRFHTLGRHWQGHRTLPARAAGSRCARNRPAAAIRSGEPACLDQPAAQ